jgi:hypothetical protein
MGMFDEDSPLPLEGLFYWACSFSKWFYWLMGAAGAIIGFFIGVEQPEHHPQYLFALLGFFSGAIAVPLLAMIVRFIVWLALIGLVLLACYYAFIKP